MNNTPALAILATYDNHADGTRAQVIQQAQRYLVRLIDTDAAEQVGLRSFPTEQAAHAWAQRCTF